MDGWSTGLTMLHDLDWLRSYDGHIDVPIELVLDISKADTCDLVKERARELNISMHLIPAGGTDLYQPLDLVVFGALKATARSEHH
jgi:hypothetical protein